MENCKVVLSDNLGTPHIDADMVVSHSPYAYPIYEPNSFSIDKEMDELRKSEEGFQKIREITKITNDYCTWTVVEEFQKKTMTTLTLLSSLDLIAYD